MTQKTAADWIRQQAGSVSGWLSQRPICLLTTLRTFVACEARVQAARGPRLPGSRQSLNAGMHATIVG